jgi:uncharacterized protein
MIFFMLMLLSPAKTLDYESPVAVAPASVPTLMTEAAVLIETLRQKSSAEISALMDISPKLADLNQARYRAWSTKPPKGATRAAVLAFNGDVYEGLDARSLDLASLAWAQSHLIILSGLYGVLRPLDALQPYRLEMGTSLTNPRGANLYRYWSDQVTTAITQSEAMQSEASWLLNLASDEYFKVVDAKRVAAPIISPVFQDEKAGRYKVISFYAKRARGLMARYAVEQRVSHPDDLLGFAAEGYAFDAEASAPLKPVFRRAEQS